VQAARCSTFPIKQGGLGTQQADAAAEHIAARFGAPVEPEPFHPILRFRLTRHRNCTLQTAAA
jgi:sulfide:quinone oxidoreductase